MSSIILEVSFYFIFLVTILILDAAIHLLTLIIATVVYVAVCLHEMSPLPLGFLVLAVGFQHLIVFIKYRYMNLYSFLLIGLEIWFQLESYYALTFATSSVRVGIGMVLMSHYGKSKVGVN